jgi:hypothetical protein
VEETVGDAAVSAVEEVVTEEDEEDSQEVVVEVSLKFPGSSDFQEIEYLGRETPRLRICAKFVRPRVADRRVRRSRR